MARGAYHIDLSILAEVVQQLISSAISSNQCNKAFEFSSRAWYLPVSNGLSSKTLYRQQCSVIWGCEVRASRWFVGLVLKCFFNSEQVDEEWSRQVKRLFMCAWFPDKKDISRRLEDWGAKTSLATATFWETAAKIEMRWVRSDRIRVVPISTGAQGVSFCRLHRG